MCRPEVSQVHLLLFGDSICSRHVPEWFLDLRGRFGLGLARFLLLQLGRIKIF
jgi:hypothetical protein